MENIIKKSKLVKEKLSVIIPCRNEEINLIDNISLYRDLSDNVHELIFVNDDSSDNTENILNNHYNFRFTDFVNDYRIKYIINKFNESYLDEFTIESVSLEAGFTTKSGFYKSFKKLYQTTPSEYFNKLKSI